MSPPPSARHDLDARRRALSTRGGRDGGSFQSLTESKVVGPPEVHPPDGRFPLAALIGSTRCRPDVCEVSRLLRARFGTRPPVLHRWAPGNFCAGRVICRSEICSRG